MTGPNPRRSLRISTSTQSVRESPDGQLAPAKRKIDTKKETTLTTKKRSKAKVSSEHVKEPMEGTKPWFYKFTKGDEEYNNYMSTEWGFEKVILLR